MKKLFVLFICTLIGFAILIPQSTKNISFAEENDYCQVIATECFLYSTASFDQKINEGDGSPIIVKHSDILKILNGTTQNGFLFVEFKNNNVYQGYIYQNYVTFEKMDQETYPVFNAKVSSESATLYDLDQQATQSSLSKNTSLYLYKGYQKKLEYTAVCFIGENGKLEYGYLRTKDIVPDGISAGVITGIMVAVSCVTIILLLIFMKKRKRKN